MRVFSILNLDDSSAVLGGLGKYLLGLPCSLSTQPFLSRFPSISYIFEYGIAAVVLSWLAGIGPDSTSAMYALTSYSVSPKSFSALLVVSETIIVLSLRD